MWISFIFFGFKRKKTSEITCKVQGDSSARMGREGFKFEMEKSSCRGNGMEKERNDRELLGRRFGGRVEKEGKDKYKKIYLFIHARLKMILFLFYFLYNNSVGIMHI